MLSVRGVHKKFDGERSKWALKGISLKAEKGNHVFVIGETGSGKSTLLKCIGGFLELDKGQIKWDNHRVLGPNEKLIAGNEFIRLVEQEYNLNQFKSIEANLLEVLPFGLYKSEQKERVAEMLDLFQLNGMGKKKPHELSGGQQQRVAIAKAFIQLPKVLLLDEPFAHFDPQMRNKVFEFLRQHIDNQDLLVVTVTHDFNETLKNADNVLVLEKGKVIQSGSAQSLYQTPKNLYVAGLLGEYNLLNVRGRIRFLRPEDIHISEKGKHKAELLKVRFCGHYAELTLNYQDTYLTAYTHQMSNFTLGSMLFFSFPQKGLELVDTESLQEWR